VFLAIYLCIFLLYFHLHFFLKIIQITISLKELIYFLSCEESNQTTLYYDSLRHFTNFANSNLSYVFLSIYLCIFLLYFHLHFVLKIIQITISLNELIYFLSCEESDQTTLYYYSLRHFANFANSLILLLLQNITTTI
jgi:hypothetical protein